MLCLQIDQTTTLLGIRQRFEGVSLQPHGDKSIARKPCFYVPFDRDPDFVDRPDIMTWIKEQYTSSAGRMALVGMGGFGKSQVASKVQMHSYTTSRSHRTSLGIRMVGQRATRRFPCNQNDRLRGPPRMGTRPSCGCCSTRALTLSRRMAMAGRRCGGPLGTGTRLLCGCCSTYMGNLYNTLRNTRGADFSTRDRRLHWELKAPPSPLERG